MAAVRRNRTSPKIAGELVRCEKSINVFVSSERKQWFELHPAKAELYSWRCEEVARLVMPRETFSIEQLEMLDTNEKQLIIFLLFRGSQKVVQLMALTQSDYNRWVRGFQSYVTSPAGKAASTAGLALPDSAIQRGDSAEIPTNHKSMKFRFADDCSPTSTARTDIRITKRGDSESPVRRAQSWKNGPLLMETLRQGRILNPCSLDRSNSTDLLSPMLKHSSSRLSNLARSVSGSNSYWQYDFCNEKDFQLDSFGEQDDIALDAERLGQLLR